ncbi:16S rRNA (cytidine(1402)-2'-O)-methyltransferase [Candidatus Nomurabacteria bacterium RIFCSPHIGHO2_01_FULL_39_9]|uniref:Ribosomal RNA small subunit methyltransferase I n=1 Tax=Candidatus Nomurabacteria bacterium RIFCSPHIGHO2_01_FULL_39_9 TaxID=1801735 RepID=A0A1F6UWY8_9BACT|nr:MAG: 16S rRNA (cytidine(1402)-2'-O)-methyltransferase [Candidatus Nomurabacteria bacterium RIFCSPHIGHO2_01_FULL_39_9]
MSKFYVVATPIGNLEDITLRALRILKEVDLILCEDTRVTKKLLNHYDIGTPTLSYHQHSRLTKVDHILNLLEEGKDLALVTDAGTPGISDPGGLLVAKIREKFGNIIYAIPGASALAAAISISGVPTDKFSFLGFLPHKKGRETLFKEIANSQRTVVFYESTHRLLKTLESLNKYLKKERKVVVCKEISKIFEEVISGRAEEVLNYFKNHKDKQKGEFVIIVESC